MNDLIPDTTAALSRAHAALLEDLQKLEASAASANLDIWQLFDRLDGMNSRLLEHFRLEEKNGYMDAVRTRSPHLDRDIDRLKDEHVQLSAAARQLLDEARSGKQIEAGFRAKLRDFIGAVRDHETRENILVEDAFNQDTGNED